VIVVDASVLATALAVSSSDGHAARQRLVADDLHAPHLIDLEVASVLRRRERARDIDARHAALALRELDDLPLARYPHLPLIPRIWELRRNVSPYVAAYVALAEALGCKLVTGDRRLARSTGVRCELEVL
jgi:predicted nucleic acid-binding protein